MRKNYYLKRKKINNDYKPTIFYSENKKNKENSF